MSTDQDTPARVTDMRAFEASKAVMFHPKVANDPRRFDRYGFHVATTRDGPQGYVNTTTEALWRVWQDAREQGRHQGWEEEHGRLARAICSTVGGMVEGLPTATINYLQRLRALVEIEQEAERLRGLLQEARGYVGVAEVDGDAGKQDLVKRIDAALEGK